MGARICPRMAGRQVGSFRARHRFATQFPSNSLMRSGGNRRSQHQAAAGRHQGNRSHRACTRTGATLMWYGRALAIGLTLISGSASAQNCFLFFCDTRRPPAYQDQYGAPGYQQPGYQQPGYQQPGYQQPYGQPADPRYGYRPDGGYGYPDRSAYGPAGGERFAVPPVPPGVVDPAFLRRTVPFTASYAAGTIVIDTSNHYLYLVQGGGQAIRYGIGVGKQGFSW